MNATATKPADSAARLGRVLGTLLIAVAVAGCGLVGGGASPPDLPSGGPAPAQQQDVLGPVSGQSRLYADNTGGFTDSLRLVVRDEGGWEDAWRRATSGQSSPPPRPAVDFRENMVVVVAAGRLTPEDRIRVDSVGVRSVRMEDGTLEDAFEIVVRTVQGCGRLRVDAFPFEIIRTRRFEGPVRFIERRSTAEGCGGP